MHINSDLLPAENTGYDIVILSDLLHFNSSHHELLFSLTSLLARTPSARVYVSAGKYTGSAVCDHFLHAGEDLGLAWEEQEVDTRWMGTMTVSLNKEQLSARKANCRFWIGRWAEDEE